MKKFIIFLLIMLAFITTFFYFYYNYKRANNEVKRENAEYSSYYNKEITGMELATLINKCVENNKINNIQKDEKGKYINNEETSIQMDISFIDDSKVHTMEEIYEKGTDDFVEYYNTIKFKCTKMEYHKKNSQVGYMFIEQVSV